VCYVLPTQTLWVAANSQSPSVFDPRGGINVRKHFTVNQISEFVNTNHNEEIADGRSSTRFRHILYMPEHNEILASTSKKAIITWKFNPYASMTTLKSGPDDPLETVIFSMIVMFQ
jgi:hypothetical protein